ncbi:MAG: hypothetical protein RMJ56_12810 [Gemmataceae bacterium]|nr:hypothetical protein [Gemmata sp.]MDW8198475.1 hypothetical protein [Gemmataceae bacterium]
MPTVRRLKAVSVITLVTLGMSWALVDGLTPSPFTTGAGWDFWNLPALRQQLCQAHQRRAELAAYEEWVLQRSETANQTARKLLYGYPLTAATDELMLLFHDDAAMLVFVNHYYAQEPTLRHRYARHTIERALRFVADDPQQRHILLQRLEAEYKTLEASPPSPSEPPR